MTGWEIKFEFLGCNNVAGSTIFKSRRSLKIGDLRIS